MNIKSIKEKLLNLGQKIGLQVQEEHKDSIILHTALAAEEYFIDTVYCRYLVYDSGTVHLFLTFSEVEKTSDRLFLINHFNETSPWFKGYIACINNKDFFELHYSTYKLENEDSVVDAFGFLLNVLLEENTINHIKAILACG
ncbi:MAG: hypothetical protein GX813_02205 [Erysipelotrichia bacterium]|nr:hypothetical protein [Erysipelotrichia bacterium]